MIVSIHQPTYWPWLGLLDKIARSNKVIILDHVQVSKGSYQYRNVFFCGGKKKFLTIPIKHHLGDTFLEITFSRLDWQLDHLTCLKNYYRKAPHFLEIEPVLQRFYQTGFPTPVAAIVRSMEISLELFSIEAEVVLSSSLGISSHRGQMVYDLCVASGASSYMAGRGSYGYMQEVMPQFLGSGIKVAWQDFSHPVYPQSTDSHFVEGLTGLDMMLWNGIDESRKIFWRNLKTKGEGI